MTLKKRVEKLEHRMAPDDTNEIRDYVDALLTSNLIRADKYDETYHRFVKNGCRFEELLRAFKDSPSS